VTAISAGVGYDLNLHCRQSAVAFRAELDARRHLMAGGSRGELLFAGIFPFHRPARGQCGKNTKIFGDHFLFAAKTAADAFSEDVHITTGQSEQMAQLLLDDERRL